MKNKLLFTILCLLINLTISNVKASVDSLNGLQARVECVTALGGINVRKLPTSSSTKIGTLTCADTFVILDDQAGSNDSCYDWFKVEFGNNQIGYTCGKYVEPIIENKLSVVETETYKASLREKGFPETYLDYLVLLHNRFPNWEFEASITNLDFNDIVNNELGGNSLIYYTYNEDYRSKEEESYNYLTDSYYRHPTEKKWWYASREAISYFLDPRIYLNENYIYIFEKLNYDRNFQTIDSIKLMFTDTFLPRIEPNYANYLMGSAEQYNISPIHLASRILQEQGMNGSISSLGGEFTYNGKTYSGYYNLFNIGAYSSDPDISPAIIGLVKAMGGVDGSDTSYGKPWNTIEKSIYGGAQFLSQGYISKGQATLYYQKWDISPTSDTIYTHQFMANITAPATEALKNAQTYKRTNTIYDSTLTFQIPVFKEGTLPDEVLKHPTKTNPNNYLSDLKINDKTIDNFNPDILEYNYTVNKNVTALTINATTISSKATVKTGNYSLTDDTKQVLDIEVTAENNSKRIYKINITKIEDGTIIKSIEDILNNISIKFNNEYISGIPVGTDISKLTTNINNYATNNNTYISVNYKDYKGNDKTTGSFKTGDIVTINNGEKDYKYEIIIRGDIDKDGEITILDLLFMKKIILNSTVSNLLEKKASDIDLDGSVSILDLLELKKDILNTKKIVQ